MAPRKTMTLREWRESKGWTLVQAGQHFGWSPQHQTQLESRGGNVTLPTVDYVALMTNGEVSRLGWPESEDAKKNAQKRQRGR